LYRRNVTAAINTALLQLEYRGEYVDFLTARHITGDQTKDPEADKLWA